MTFCFSQQAASVATVVADMQNWLFLAVTALLILLWRFP